MSKKLKIIRIFKQYSSQLIAGLFLILSIYYLSANSSDFRQVVSIDYSLFILVAIAHLAVLSTTALFTKATVNHLKKRLTFIRSFQATLVGSIGNFFMPIGSGTALRGAYLKKETGLTYSSFASLLLANYVFMFLFNSVAGQVLLLTQKNKLNPQLFITISILLTGTAIVMATLTFFRTPKSVLNWIEQRGVDNRLAKTGYKILSGLEQVKQDKKLVRNLFFYIVLNFISIAGVVYVSYLAVGAELLIAPIILFSAFDSLSIVFNITPGSIGFREAIFLIAAPAFSIPAEVIIGASLVDRSIKLIVLGVSWVVIKYTKTDIYLLNNRR